MPKALEEKLERQAARKGLTGKSRDAYVYGTMRRTGWVPERERKSHPQGEAVGGEVGGGPPFKW